ncbi:SusC/RagA family TonB-linked outer membrane protein [Chitinophaga sp. YIM B06452]|uniref:SusC/RagA family TonB-linked outer membrane protein n=1 Tax=Chitinophaga sp. YIM B06452 TaxID=3082158 RepID=UPI0031FEA0FE
MQKVYSLLRKNVKWRAVSLIFMAVQSNAFAAAQDSSNVSLNFTNQPIENVFIALEKQTGYTVFFSGSTLDGNTPITVKVSQVTLSNALAAVLRGKNITWTIKHKGIVLSKKPVAAEAPAEPVNAVLDTVPMINVSGVVVDAKGNPIPAATVSLKGYPRGQGTDNMGRFSFTRVPGNGTLVFSSLGYDPKQVRIAGRGEIRVALDSAIRDIQGVEVVSTGYQSIPKERATGSFVQLDNKLLSRTPSTNILDRIGYVTNSLRYDPNGIAGTKYVIRGFSTINANRQPLIVIDGFPYEEMPVANIIERLNPNDVESITILRDAAAASIWGARSGNGVIVITTKKGNFNSKTEINFTSNLTLMGKPKISEIPIMSSKDAIGFEKNLFNSGYYDAYDDLYPAYNLFPIISPAMELLYSRRRSEITDVQLENGLEKLSNHNVNDDIDKYFLRNPISQQYNLSIKGGSDKSNYYTSFGYDNNLGADVGNKSSRYTLNFTSIIKLNKIIELNYFIDYSLNTFKNNRIGYSQLVPYLGNNIYNYVAPYTMLADESGQPLHIPNSSDGGYRKPYLDTVSAVGLLDWHYKPIEEKDFGSITSKVSTTRIGGNVRFNILQGLSLDVKGQYFRSNNVDENYASGMAYSNRNMVNKFMYYDAGGGIQYPFPLGGTLTTLSGNQRSWNARGQLNYNKSWSRGTVTAILGTEASETKYNSSTSSLYGYNKETLTFMSNMDFKNYYTTRPGGGQELLYPIQGTNGTIRRYRSYFGNASYAYDKRYTVSASGRIDEANVLGVKANLRKVPLWSVGGAWNITNENFFHVEKINHLNLRLTYGWNGNINNNVSQLATIIYSPSFNLYSPLPFASISTPPNPNITWEKVKTWNAALDFKSFNNRLSGTIEFYRKNGVDLIGPIQSEATKGIPTFYYGNYAGIRSTGFDIQLDGHVVRRKNVGWNIITNFSFNKEKVTDYKYLVADAEQNSDNYLGSSVVFKGKPLYQLYAYKWGGLDPKTGDPRGIIADTIAPYDIAASNKNTKPEDLVHFGSIFPRITGNILNSIQIHRFTVSFNITYKLKYYFSRKSMNYTNLITYWVGHSDYSERWKKSGDEIGTNVPSEVLAPNPVRDYFYSKSSVLVEKGDHIRLQDFKVDYSIPTRGTSVISGINISLLASNVGILWRANKFGLDPDSPEMPLPRSFTMGVTARF